MRTNTIAAVSIITAIIVSSNYVLMGFPQIKLMDSMVFLTGYLFGVRAAVSVSILSWLVYGSINPLGTAGFPLIVVLMIGEMVYGIAGYLFRKYYNMQSKLKKNPIEIIKYKEIYEFLEDLTDKCEDIANVIESIVVKHA